MTESATGGAQPRIPASLQRRPVASTSGAKILALGASVAAGISLVGAMAVGALPDPVVSVPQPEVIVVRVHAPPTVPAAAVPVSSTTAPVPANAAPAQTTAPAASPEPTTVSEGS